MHAAVPLVSVLKKSSRLVSISDTAAAAVIGMTQSSRCVAEQRDFLAESPG